MKKTNKKPTKTLIQIHAVEIDNPYDDEDRMIDDYYFFVDESVTKVEDVVPILQQGLIEQFGFPHFGSPDNEDENNIDEKILTEWENMNFYFGRELQELNLTYLKKHGIEPVYPNTINVDWDNGDYI